MSAPEQPSALEAARAAGRAEAEEIFAGHERAKAARLEALQQRRQEQEAARRRLADPFSPSPEMERSPELEHADALAAAHMISVARRDARNLEVNVMRQILARGVTWDELAETLDTTAEQLRDSVRRPGARPETWTVPTGEPE